MAGNLNGFAYKTNGDCWTWGGNSFGQLGNNTLNTYSSPVQISGNHSFMQIVGGFTNSIGLKQNGEAWTWGDNGYGSLGNNTITSESSPVAVVGDHSFLYVTSNARNCFGVKEDGTTWGWGNNTLGGLGTGNVTNYSSPVQVVGSHSFRYVSGGGSTANNQAGGLKADGTLWMWGCNSYGQLGNNSTTHSSSPIAVVGDHSFISFCSGDSSLLALKADGSAWSWGRNLTGVLGTGDLTIYSSPVQVIGNHSFISISMSIQSTSAALKEDGSVWTWGNGVGLGDGTITSKSSPVQVVGNHSFIQLRASFGPTFLGLKSDGSVWAWGANGYGQLGNNSITNTSSPVQVVGDHSFLTLETGLDLNIAVGSSWIKRPIGYILKSDTWYRIMSSLVKEGTSWRYSSRELR